MREHRQRTAAFTLAELLVVTAVLSVLAAVLLPVFAEAREKARQIACVSNERQLGRALLQYAQDNDEAFPPGLRLRVATTNGTSAPFGLGWAGPCWSYVHSAAVFRCPDDPTAPHATDGVADADPISYGLNSNAAGRTQAALDAPTGTVLAFEVTGAHALLTDVSEGTQGYSVPPPTGFLSPAGNGMDLVGGATVMADGVALEVSDADSPVVQYVTGAIGTRFSAANAIRFPLFQSASGVHHGGANYLAADGHVVFLHPADVSGGLDAPAPDCLQNTDAGQPADCTGTPPWAAGTGSDKYRLTFSTR